MATIQLTRALGNARTFATVAAMLTATLFAVPRGLGQDEALPPARVREALRIAIDHYKKGDYKEAAGYFETARSGQKSLELPEQQDLATFSGYNTNALKSREDGAEQMRQASDALQKGRHNDAGPLLNALNSNQHLSPTDRAQLAVLNKNMQAHASVSMEVKGEGKSFLTAGRSALQAGDLDAAETFASQAEKENSLLPAWMQPWSDSPTKLRRDIQAARAKQLANKPAAKADGGSWLPNINLFAKTEKTEPAPAPKQAESSTSKFGFWPFGGSASKNDGPAPGGKAEGDMARQILRDGFIFLEANDIEKARILAIKVKQMNIQWNPNEQTPDLLLHEIQRRTGGGEPTSGPNMAGFNTDAQKIETPKKSIEIPKNADPRALVKMGRSLLAQKKYDDADKVCTHALNMQTRWGLWEDNPEKLRRDLVAARKVSDRDESVKLMADARKLLGQGSLDEAEKKAYRAKQLHGPFGAFDFGDRPDKLIEEIGRAKQARGDQPNPLDKNAQAKDNLKKSPLDAIPAGVQIANKNRAIVILREARELERQSMLVEARQKVLEARAMRAPFAPDEESPEHMLMSLTARCDRQIVTHLQQAVDVFSNANDAKRFENSQVNLNAARRLAHAFDLDCNRIDQTAHHLQQVAAGSRPLQTVGGVLPFGQSPFQIEQAKVELSTGDPKKDELRRIAREKLKDAQRELSHGKYSQARKMAEDLFNPMYGIQEDVQRFVRSINAEETNQQILEAKRNFDVAVDSLAARDYKKAMGILQQIDPMLLPDQYQARMRDIMSMREMQPHAIAQVGKTFVQGSKIEEKKPYDGPQEDLLSNVRAAESVQFQALRQRGSDALRKAHEQWKLDQREDAIKTLRGYIEQVNLSGLDQAKTNDLRRSIDSRLQQYSAMQAEKVLDGVGRNERFVMQHPEGKNIEEKRKQQQEIVGMMKEAHEHYKNNKLKEAEAIARKVLEIDRENGPALMMLRMAETRYKQERWDKDEIANREWIEQGLAHRLPPVLDPVGRPVEINPEFVKRRQQYGDGSIPHHLKDEKEKAIHYRLRQPISFNFKDVPLQQAIKDLSVMSGVQVVPDMRALQDARVDLSSPLSASIEDVDMKFALNILLNPLRLTYIIEDQVLKITTENRTIGRLVRITYPIADLIVPVEDHVLPDVLNITKALERSMSPNGFYPAQGMTPPPYTMNGGTPVSSHGPGGLGGAFGTQNPGHGGMPGPMQKEKTKDQMAEILKDLIQNTISKDKWENMGGNGSIQYFPMGLAFVISQPQEVQEEIQLLLATLRKLQDLQVSVELRAVLVSETFFERIGLDFDMNIRTPTSANEGALVTGNFVPAPFVNRIGQGLNMVSGLTSAGTLTPDLNFPIRNSTFNFTTPQFGGYQPEAGLSLGLAFLSDIQVFMFLEAVQGDRRAHIMQAPKISVYNGQSATITGLMLRPVVTGVIPVPLANGALVLVPQTTAMPFGLGMTVQPVVSPDRRYIRLNVTPILTAPIQDPAGAVLIPVPQQIVGTLDGGVPQPPFANSNFNVQINQTATNLTILNTTVNVPDGGTVLLGGFKFLAEERTEYGPPILSKIPYLSRLFRNVGWSRDGSTLMYLVTARVIMIEEEEGRFMGTIPELPQR